MRTTCIVCLLFLIAFSALGLSHKKAAKLKGNTSPSNNYVESIAANINYDDDTTVNGALNALVDVEGSDEHSASHSEQYSKEEHHDSQKIDISINFNIALDDSSN